MQKIHEKTDLREFSDKELSLLVYNTESLFNQRHERHFLNMIKNIYLFTNAQFETLVADLVEEGEEL